MKAWIFRKSKQVKDYLMNLPWIKILLTFVSVIPILWLTNFILEWVPRRDFLTILPTLKITIFLLIVLGSALLSFRKEFNIENHQGLINCLLIIITIAFTSAVYFIDRQNSFYNTNTDLVRANEINSEIADAIIKKAYDKGYPFIRFLTEPYEKNVYFISKNYTLDDCIGNYYRVMMEMRILNDVTSSVIMHAVEESSVRELMNNKAVSTRGLIQKIIKECHPPGASRDEIPG